MSNATPQALVIGAVTWDHDLDRPRASPRPGGVPTFAGRALARLGVTTRVVTRIDARDDAVLAPLRAAGVEVLALPSRRTTTYGNRYGGSDDGHELWERSDPIVPGDVPASWLGGAQAVVAGPLHPHDVAPACVADTAGVVGVDLQGLLRGERLGHDAVQPLVRAWCRVATVVQVSATDLAALFDATSARAIRTAYGIRELVITWGARGATVATATGVLDVPAARVVQGETRGAGDAHLAAYVLGRALGREPIDAATAASMAAARSIEAGEPAAGAPHGA